MINYYLYILIIIYISFCITSFSILLLYIIIDIIIDIIIFITYISFFNKINDLLVVKSGSSDENFIKSSGSNIISSAIYQNEEFKIENSDKDKEKGSDDADNKNQENEASTSNKHSTSNMNQENKDDDKNNDNSNHNTQEVKEKLSTSSNPSNTKINVEDTTKVNDKLKSSLENEGSKSNFLHNNSSSKNNIEHKMYIEKDTSEEFYKGICGNYYRYESDESSESVYSDLDLQPNIEKPRKGRHRKNISMSYPTVSEGQSTISIDRSIDNDINFFIGSNGTIEEDVKEYEQQSSSNIIINKEIYDLPSNPDKADVNANTNANANTSANTNANATADTNANVSKNVNKNDEKNKGEGLEEDIHPSQKYLSVKKSRLHKEYSSDGDVTDHENFDSNVPNSHFSDREIKKLIDQSGIVSEKVSQENIVISSKPSNKNLYFNIVKNAKSNQAPSDEFSEFSIVGIGIRGSDNHMSNDLSSKTEISTIKKDTSERVDITDICEDRESLKTASIEDCTSQVNVVEEEVELDKFDDVNPSAINHSNEVPTIHIFKNELNHRFEENLDCILEENPVTVNKTNDGGSSSNSKENSSSSSQSIKDSTDNQSINNNVVPLSRNNASTPDNLNISSENNKSNKNSGKGHFKNNSYSYNEARDGKYNIHPPFSINNALSASGGFSTISGSFSYSGNLFGTYGSDISDKFSDKVNKYYSLKNERRNTSRGNSNSNSLKIRNSSRDIYASFKKLEPRSRLDKSFNTSITKRTKKPMNIQFIAKHFNDTNGSGEDEESGVSDVDISSGLTAKEFAKLVGINILYDDDEKEEMANQQNQGIAQPPADPHQPIDLAMFIPPNPNELATLHTTLPRTTASSLHSSLDDSRSVKSITDSASAVVNTNIRTAPSTRSRFDFIVTRGSASNNTNSQTHDQNQNHSQNQAILPSFSGNSRGLIAEPNSESSISSLSKATIQRNHSEKEVTFKTQSTISAKGRTFEVSYSSNSDYNEKSRPSSIVTVTSNKVRNSKTEPNFQSNEFNKPISRESSVDNNSKIKSSSNVRSTVPSVSIVHGGPSEEMCRSILEKANPVIKIERENRTIADSPLPMSDNDLHNVNNDYGIEKIKLGETQTRPINRISLQSDVDSSCKVSPIITPQKPTTTNVSNSTTNAQNPTDKVITYNKPLLSNNSKVIFFRSKRNNYVNLQSTSLEGSKHRYKRRFEIRSNKNLSLSKIDDETESESSHKGKDKGKSEENNSPKASKKNSIFYSASPIIKNLRTFSFISSRQSSSVSSNLKTSSPSSPSPSSNLHNPKNPLKLETKKVDILEEVEEPNVETDNISNNNNNIASVKPLSPLIYSHSPNSYPSPNITSTRSVDLVPPQSLAQISSNSTSVLQQPGYALSQNSSLHLQNQPSVIPVASLSNENPRTILLSNSMSGEIRIPSSSLIDTSVSTVQPLQKNHLLSTSTSLATPSTANSTGTPHTSHTVITMSTPTNNQTVITTTKTTTSNRHTFITTKTTNVPISSLLIDTSNISVGPTSPTTTLNSSTCYTKEELLGLGLLSANSSVGMDYVFPSNEINDKSVVVNPLNVNINTNTNNATNTNINTNTNIIINTNTNTNTNTNNIGGCEYTSSSIDNSSFYHNKQPTTTTISSNLGSKHSSYNDSFIINSNRVSSSSENAAYNHSKNLSNYDISNAHLFNSPHQPKTISVSSHKMTKLSDLSGHKFSNSTSDMTYDLSSKSFRIDSNRPIPSTINTCIGSSGKPLMISTPNSLKISKNIEMISQSQSQPQPQPNSPSSVSFNAGFTNMSMMTSPLSEECRSFFSESNHSKKSSIPTSPSLGNFQQQQQQSPSGVKLQRHPKSLYIPRSHIQAIKEISNSNISINSVVTKEETKGRFQIEKSEERPISSGGGAYKIPSKSNSTKSEVVNRDNNTRSVYLPRNTVSASNVNNAMNTPTTPTTDILTNNEYIHFSNNSYKSDESINDNYDAFGLNIQMKSNSYCNDGQPKDSILRDMGSPILRTDSNISNSSQGIGGMGTPRIHSTNVSNNTLDQRRFSASTPPTKKGSFINDKLFHLQSMLVSSCDSLLKKSERGKNIIFSKHKGENSGRSFKNMTADNINKIDSFIDSPKDQIKGIENSNNSLGESIEISSTSQSPNSSNKLVNASTPSISKKKEIVKGRFTIIQGS